MLELTVDDREGFGAGRPVRSFHGPITKLTSGNPPEYGVRSAGRSFAAPSGRPYTWQPSPRLPGRTGSVGGA